MPLKATRWIFPVFLLCCLPLLCHAVQQPLTPSQLADQANSISDLSKLGSYQLKAIVAVGDEKHGATGTLTVDHDQQNTRQELEFTDYHELSLIRGETHYYRRTPSIPVFAAERVQDFDELWRVSIPPESEVGAVSAAKVQGVHALCFTMRPDKFTRIRNCFDAATHLLLSRTTESDESFEAFFLDYQEIEGVHIPATIRFHQAEKAPIEVRKVAVLKTTFTAEHFVPPPGLRGFHTCREVQPPRLAKRVNPEYPNLAIAGHIMGPARLLVEIGEDGKVRAITPISGHPLLLEAAATAVKQWEYKPAVCTSGAAESEVIVVVRFHMESTVSGKRLGTTQGQGRTFGR